jgi:hypothetical protein
MKYQIFQMQEDESWTLIEELQDDLALAGRIQDLRKDGSIYRAEQKDGFLSKILDI